MNISPDAMRNTLRLWASGVSIVTTVSGDQRAGMTVSAFNSLCLEPPMILVCLNKNTHAGELVRESGVFAVSILSADQAALSERFAGRVPLAEGEGRFDGVPVITAETGSPIIGGALAWLDCRVETIHDGGSHWIVIGEVLATGAHEVNHAPLLYFDRGYHEIEREKAVNNSL
jgi:flavin reductase (DIM6/NTAB) family NADH-FMN oxidoreductase RutF